MFRYSREAARGVPRSDRRGDRGARRAHHGGRAPRNRAPKARLEGERGRTTGQLRLFASHIRKGDYLDRRHDEALPDRKPLPRPDLKLIQRPIGPVAVFGASTSRWPSPSPAATRPRRSRPGAGGREGPLRPPGHGRGGGRGHPRRGPGHRRPPGVFSLIQGGDRRTGEALVQHPLIRAWALRGPWAGARRSSTCAQRGRSPSLSSGSSDR
jgi:NADP-dependent aldehyde dehydrogenase